ncbi:Endo-1,4-beta-xylanase Z precursor [Rubripirellula tenax]|uniref:endo-1,4-beta-xylanase n=1 Tax=Rubripirellula tenax TaxID=2528015 RepID=A0A5C6FDF8_9BACT|nr:endo-1,4-beta-xylanase [Rubripirellula tenax]TWU58620.1 Endo-1,4-beta-xylanase Z precursor [Rubripirellula tenax]
MNSKSVFSVTTNVAVLLICLLVGEVTAQDPSAQDPSAQDPSAQDRSAQDPDSPELKNQGHTIISPIPPDQMKVFLGDRGTKSIVRRADGSAALRVDVPEQGEKNWSVLHHSPANTGRIRKGDLLAYSLRLRITGERTDVGDVGVYAESSVPEKKGSEGGRIHPTTELQTFRRSVISPGDFEPGEFILSVHLAAKAQVVEIYSVSLDVFPPDTPTDQLAVDGITWPGREIDAAWRKDADSRIEQIRKRPIAINVIDAEGKPVVDADIAIVQKRHAWRFGTFVGGRMLGDTEDAIRYRDEVLKRYNFVTLPAYLADWGWRNPKSRADYFRLADWAQANSMPARGHLLVYPGWTATPPEWFNIPKPELLEKMNAHIPRATRAYMARGVTEWDVANELRYNEEFMNEVGGVEVAADWFKLARKHNPSGDLYLNETVVLTNGGHTETEQAALERHFKILARAGAPIDGIGLQGHFASELTGATRLLEILERMSKLSPKIMITEFDMDNDDASAKADYIRDFYTVCFSHPAVQGIVQWGFWEGDMWKPRGHLIAKDWQLTPAGRVYEDLVTNTWWTRANGTSDSEGEFLTRAFLGTQTVTVDHDGYQWTGDVEVGTDGATVTVIVP